MSFNAKVRQYWEREPCGTAEKLLGRSELLSPEWFGRVRTHRYGAEPHIAQVAQFEQGRAKRVLEIGVGAGADHVEWARAGAESYGVDLTEAALITTRHHLQLHGLDSRLSLADAEHLPFDDSFFDLVYSWGVIHHSERPDRIVSEIYRVLRPKGRFVGMIYNRHSLVVAKLWVRYAIARGKPFLGLRTIVANHMESPGTKAYTRRELQLMFQHFDPVKLQPIVTVYDRKWLPRWLHPAIPVGLGWNFAITADKPG